MSESKTYVFGENQGNGMLGLLAPLLQQRGLDPNMVAAMMNNRNGNNGFGGEGGWFMWVIFLFFLMGWGGNGFGFGNRGSGAGLANEINNDYGRSLLLQAINGNGNAITQLASNLNCSVGQIQSAINGVMSQVQSVGNQVGMSGQTIINAIQAGNNQLASQLAQCCCENKQLTITQGYDNRIQNMEQTTQLVAAGNQNTQAILAKLDAAETRAMQDKIDTLREKNSQQAVIINNAQQSAQFAQMINSAITPVNAGVQALANEVEGIKCKLPETTTIPYSPVVGVPQCVAAQIGLYGNTPYATGFWG